MQELIEQIDYFVDINDFLMFAKASAQHQEINIAHEEPTNIYSRFHEGQVAVVLTADKQYRITRERTYWEDTEDIENPSTEDIVVCLERKENEHWVTIVMSSDYRSNYKDDYYGMCQWTTELIHFRTLKLIHFLSF